MLSKELKKLTKEAESGDVIAQYNLGITYMKGLDVDIDLKQAKFWFEQSAAQGDEDAEEALDIMKEWEELAYEYYEIKKYDKAFEYMIKIADIGDENAQVIVGWMYKTGTGTHKNLHQALYYYEQAAEQGHADAQWNTSLLYAGQNNENATLHWLRKAAGQGHEEALAIRNKYD